MIRNQLLRRRPIAAAIALISAVPLIFFGWRWETSNLGELEPGRIYRSAQMDSKTLAETIRRNRIKTVLNLRGTNVAESWYRAERDATVGAGASLVDISMSSSQWMSRAQLKTVIRVLDTSDYPLVIHCQWGAERTGLISAFATLLREGATLDDAKAQFSLYYMYVRGRDGKRMAEHLDQYEAWLKTRQQPHSPGRFREWVDHGFVPKSPGREDWPYDPYPLVVVTRPVGKSATLFQKAPASSSSPVALRKEFADDARPR